MSTYHEQFQHKKHKINKNVCFFYEKEQYTFIEVQFPTYHQFRYVNLRSRSGTSSSTAFLLESAGTLVSTSRIACSSYLRVEGDREYTLAHPQRKKSHGVISHDRTGHSREPRRPSQRPGSSLLRKWRAAVAQCGGALELSLVLHDDHVLISIDVTKARNERIF